MLKGPELEAVRSKLSAAGHDYSIGGAAKVFVHPEQYQGVMLAISQKGIELKASHVIIAKSLMPELEASIASNPSSKNVQVKKDGIFVLTSGAHDDAQEEGRRVDEREEVKRGIDEHIEIVGSWQHILQVEFR